MNKTVHEQGLEEGIVRGQRKTIRRILQTRFGELSEAIQERLAQYPADHLDDLAAAAAVANSLKELGLED